MKHAHQDIKELFSCDQCDKSYLTMHSLKRHIRDIHQDIKEVFACDHCDKTYPTKDSLGRHTRITHKGL